MNDTVIIIIMVKCTEVSLEDTRLKKPVTLLIRLYLPQAGARGGAVG